MFLNLESSLARCLRVLGQVSSLVKLARCLRAGARWNCLNSGRGNLCTGEVLCYYIGLGCALVSAQSQIVPLRSGLSSRHPVLSSETTADYESHNKSGNRSKMVRPFKTERRTCVV